MPVPILAFHKVGAHPRAGEPSDMAVPPERFAEQMAMLADEGYQAVGISSLLAHWQGAPAPAPRPVAITFDDGYLDNATEALPILERHRFRAHVFLIGDYLGAAEGARPVPRIVPDVPMLGPAEVKALIAAGWGIGSHGMSHRRLPLLPHGDVVWELSASRDLLRSVCGGDVDTFCYPYGAYDARVAGLVKAAGYRAAFTVRTGPVRQGADCFALRRVPVGPRDTARRLRARLHPMARLVGAAGWRSAELSSRIVRR